MSNPISYIGGVNIADIKTINDIEYTGWEEVYSIDFSEAGNSGAMATGDTHDIDGVTWTAFVDSGGTTYGTAEVKNGAGLILVPADSATDLWSGKTEVPMLTASVSTIIPDLNQNDVLCLQTVLSWSADSGNPWPMNSYEAAGCFFWNGVHGSSQRFVGGDNLGTGNANWRAFLGSSTGTYTSVAASSSPTYFTWETVLYVNGQAAIVSTGPSGSTTLEPPLEMSGTFPDGTRTRRHMYAPSGYTTAGSWRTTASDIANSLTPSNLEIFIWAMKVASPREVKATFKQLRLFRSRKK